MSVKLGGFWCNISVQKLSIIIIIIIIINIINCVRLFDEYRGKGYHSIVKRQQTEIYIQRTIW